MQEIFRPSSWSGDLGSEHGSQGWPSLARAVADSDLEVRARCAGAEADASRIEELEALVLGFEDDLELLTDSPQAVVPFQAIISEARRFSFFWEVVAGVERATARVRLPNHLGLHARASAKLISLAGEFQAILALSEPAKGQDGPIVPADSIMGILLLAVPAGAEVEVRGLGPDAEAAVLALARLMQSGFGEIY